MRNNVRNNQMNKRKLENMRRKQMIKGIMFAVEIIILFVLIICIRNIFTRLNEMQKDPDHIDVPQNGTAENDIGTQIVEAIKGTYNAEGIDGEQDLNNTQGNNEESTDDIKHTDYVEYIRSLGDLDIGKPQDRTEDEVLTRLNELAKDSLVIKNIYENHSLYPEELLVALANNPELLDFASGYLDPETVTGGFTESEIEQDFPLFLQWDPRWGYQSYGENCIGLAGCGPTSLSMVLFYLTRDETLTPDYIAKYSMENGHYVKGSGTSWSLMTEMPKLYDIKVSEVGLSETSMKTALDNGSIIICAMRKGYFTVAGHFIVIYGYDRDGFWVNDPNCVSRSDVKWAYSDIKSQIRNIWAYKKGR